MSTKEVLSRVTQLKGEGKAMPDIAKVLKEEGFTTATGSHYSAKYLHVLLSKKRVAKKVSRSAKKTVVKSDRVKIVTSLLTELKFSHEEKKALAFRLIAE